VAADRVGVECMGIDPAWVGYLNYAWKLGLGQYDLAKINLVGGVAPATVKRSYKLHDQVADELEWMQAFPLCNNSVTRGPRDLGGWSPGLGRR
jgi:hypothetical protein